jgi:hypothetical protein
MAAGSIPIRSAITSSGTPASRSRNAVEYGRGSRSSASLRPKWATTTSHCASQPYAMRVVDYPTGCLPVR